MLWQVARQRSDGDRLVAAGLGQLVMGVTFIPLFYGRAPLVATERAVLAFYRSRESRRRPEIADARRGSVTRDRVNGGPGGRHLHTGLVADRDWPKPTAERAVAMATTCQCKKVIGIDWDNWDNLRYSVAD